MLIEQIFGNILKDLRKAKKWSQEQLALEADLDRTYISLLERGKNSPTLNTLFLLATALGITTSEIIKKLEQELIRYPNIKK